MDIVELIQNNGKCGFSFEVLPPLKGKGIVQIYNAIDKLNEFDEVDAEYLEKLCASLPI